MGRVVTNHREDSSENANLLRSRRDVVVPIVVGSEEVEHDLYQSLASNSSEQLLSTRKLTMRFIVAYV
jgi:hypothetical protein